MTISTPRSRGTREGHRRGDDHALSPPRLAHYVLFMGLSGATSVLLMLYVVIAAHVLGQTEYGRFGALFGVVQLLGVAFTALQTQVAGKVASATATAEIGAGLASARRTITRWLIAVVALGTIVGPLMTSLLSTSGLSAGLVVALAAETVLWAGCLGVVQGAERFIALGALTAAQGGLRLVGLLVVASSPTVEVILGSTVLSMIPALAASLALARPAHRHGQVRLLVGRATPPPVALGAPRAIDTFTLTLVMGFLTIGDVIAARIALPADGAAAVAAVAVAGRILVFFAGLVAVVAYPRFLKEPRRAVRTAGTATAVVVIAAVPILLVVLAAPQLVLGVLVGETQPSALALLPGYALAAAALAVAAPGCYLQLARRNLRFIYGFLVPALVSTVALCMARGDSVEFVRVLAFGGIVILTGTLVATAGAARRPGMPA